MKAVTAPDETIYEYVEKHPEVLKKVPYVMEASIEAAFSVINDRMFPVMAEFLPLRDQFPLVDAATLAYDDALLKPIVSDLANKIGSRIPALINASIQAGYRVEAYEGIIRLANEYEQAISEYLATNDRSALRRLATISKDTPALLKNLVTADGALARGERSDDVEEYIGDRMLGLTDLMSATKALESIIADLSKSDWSKGSIEAIARIHIRNILDQPNANTRRSAANRIKEKAEKRRTEKLQR